MKVKSYYVRNRKSGLVSNDVSALDIFFEKDVEHLGVTPEEMQKFCDSYNKSDPCYEYFVFDPIVRVTHFWKRNRESGEVKEAPFLPRAFNFTDFDEEKGVSLQEGYEYCKYFNTRDKKWEYLLFKLEEEKMEQEKVPEMQKVKYYWKKTVRGTPTKLEFGYYDFTNVDLEYDNDGMPIIQALAIVNNKNRTAFKNIRYWIKVNMDGEILKDDE